MREETKKKERKKTRTSAVRARVRKRKQRKNERKVCVRVSVVSAVCVSVRFLLFPVLATLHSLDRGQLAHRLLELPGLNS